MMITQETDWYEICVISSRLTELFAQTIATHQIAFSDWHEIMTSPLENSCAEYESDLITRMLYAVRQGIVKVVDEV